MGIKTKIKNDFWKWNYVLPFVKKHQFDEKGKVDMTKHVLKAYSHIRPVRSRESTVGFDTKALLNEVRIIIDSDSRFVYCIDTQKTLAVPGNILSNFPLDYGRIIHGTFSDISKMAFGDDEYGREAKAIADGIDALRRRIINALKDAKVEQHPICDKVSVFEQMFERPACHFEEALQRILFFNQIMWQTRHRLNGLGRLDKILGDLYQKDFESGIISYESASEIVFDFLSQLSKYSRYKSDALEGDIGQIIILGGKETDGTYFCNDLTKIFLEQQARLAKPDPKTLLRVGVGMPDSLLALSVECLNAKTGSPLYSNDDVVIPALLDFGMPEEDAYSYCTSACWEPFIVGKSLDQNNVAVFDFFTALDKVLGRDCSSFDDLFSEYKRENKSNFIKFLADIDALKWAKDPLVSMFTDGCNEARKDISDGAAVYNNYGITTVALPNVVDSLINIKRLVFDQKKYSLNELNQFRENNYAEDEHLYEHLQNLPKHYGHDDTQVIALVNEITSDLSAIAENYKNRFGGTVKFGLSSPGYNMLSKKTAADVSGRKKGMPYSTHISCLDASYTEVVGFASRLDSTRNRFNGNVIDFFVSPRLLSSNAGKFVIFLKGAIASGFFQMQMNVMSSKTLVDAKQNPEKYKGLIVRVWGFSAYFNELPESYKDLLIARSIAAEKIG